MAPSPEYATMAAMCLRKTNGINFLLHALYVT